MVLLLHPTALVSVVISLLVVASIVMGKMSNAVIVVGKLEFESQIYVVYVEDPAHKLRIILAGTQCFEALPDWVYPKAKLVHAPILDYGTFYVERVNDVMEMLGRCRPFKS